MILEKTTVLFETEFENFRQTGIVSELLWNMYQKIQFPLEVKLDIYNIPEQFQVRL